MLIKTVITLFLFFAIFLQTSPALADTVSVSAETTFTNGTGQSSSSPTSQVGKTNLAFTPQEGSFDINLPNGAICKLTSSVKPDSGYTGGGCNYEISILDGRISSFKDLNHCMAQLPNCLALGKSTCGSSNEQVSNPPADSLVSFGVSANQEWCDSGITIAAGQKFTISSTGSWQWKEDEAEVDSSGADQYLGSVILPSAKVGSLLGRINYTGFPFEIGSGATYFNGGDAGPLYLTVNATPGTTSHLTGGVNVTVSLSSAFVK